jgi:hypothetical protein
MDNRTPQAQHEAMLRLTREAATPETSARAAQRRGLARYLAAEFKRVTRSASSKPPKSDQDA